MAKIEFSKLYYNYVLMRNEIEEDLQQAQKEYKIYKTHETKQNMDILKRELQLMNKVINNLYYCQKSYNNYMCSKCW